MLWWWYQQSSTPFPMLVFPPRYQGVTWCISHQAAGTVHPGMVQPPSRAVMARRWAWLKKRFSVLRLCTSLFGPNRISWKPPAQRACFTVVSEIGASTPSIQPTP